MNTSQSSISTITSAQDTNESIMTTAINQQALEIYSELFSGHRVRVYGSETEPLFHLADVLRIIGSKREPSSVVKEYGIDDPKYIQKLPYDNRRVNYLTKRGILEILCRSRSTIAMSFKDFIYDLLDKLHSRQLILVSAENERLIHENQQLAIQMAKSTKTGYIYKVTSKDPEDPFVYYGSTNDLIHERWEEHKAEMRSRMKNNKFFKYVLEKGIQQFDVYKVEDVHYTDEKELLSREQHYIDLHAKAYRLNTRNPIAKTKRKSSL